MEQLKADLHMHTRWSDGSMEPDALLKTARLCGLQVAAVTDHDTMAGQQEALDRGRAEGLRMVSGVEISAFDPGTGRKVHILGYDVGDRELVTARCRPFLKSRHEATLRAAQAVADAGYPIEREDLLPYAGREGILYRQHILHALADRGYTSSIYGELSRTLFGGGSQRRSRYMPAETAVRLIREADGFPVLAHPFQYDSFHLLPDLVHAGLLGLEYRHPTQTPERQRAVMEAAGTFGLFLTGGSDTHGLYSEGPDPVGSVRFLLPEDHPLLSPRYP